MKTPTLASWQYFCRKYVSFSTSFLLVLALPASTNYQLRDFGIGSGGSSTASSSNYKANVLSGEVSGEKLDGASYDMGNGLAFVNQSNVPYAPLFTNLSDYYNKLQLVLQPSGNPSDTKFAIAISDDSFVTTRYVQSDATIGPLLGSEDYQTYAAWGGASGFFVIGLSSDTTYTVKVKSMQGSFTETEYGPIASSSTVSPTMTFDIDVASSDTDTEPPFTVNFGDLTANAVVNGPQKIWVDFSTNGSLGGKIYIAAKNAGLKSSAAAHTIDAVSGNLATLHQGFGVQASSVGGLSAVSPYDQTGDGIGAVDTIFHEAFVANGPVVNGRGAFLLKAKFSMETPSATDYSETLNIISSASF